MRFGFHMQPTTLVLTFSSALDPTSAQNVNNYQILTSSGTAIPISSAVYDPTTLTVTLSPSQLLSLQTFYQLTVIGTPPTGLTSATGVPIDGADNGTSGTNYVMTFSGEILAGPAPTLLRTDPTRFALEQKKMAAVDKRAAAVPHESAKLRKSLTAAEKKMAAVTQKLAVKPTRNGSSTASAVDDVLGSGTVSVKRIVAKRRGAARKARAHDLLVRVVSAGKLDGTARPRLGERQPRRCENHRHCRRRRRCGNSRFIQ